jgi:hypothetical protein
VPTYEHDEPLYLNKREQLAYNVQDKRQIDARAVKMPSREQMMYPELSDPSSRFFSSMLSRHA